MLVPISSSSSSSSVSKQTFPKFQLTFYTSRRQRGSFEKANDSLQDSRAKACLSSNFHVDQYAWKVSFLSESYSFPLATCHKVDFGATLELLIICWKGHFFFFFAFLLLNNCILNTSQSIGRELLCTPTWEGQFELVDQIHIWMINPYMNVAGGIFPIQIPEKSNIHLCATASAG